jgi:hypothetical protein
MKNPQTTIAPTFLTHIISAIGGVYVDFYAKIFPILYPLLDNSTTRITIIMTDPMLTYENQFICT